MANLITDSSFETGTGWSLGDASRSNAYAARTGSYVLEHDYVSGAVANTDFTTATTESSGTRIHFAVWFKPSAGTGSIYIVARENGADRGGILLNSDGSWSYLNASLTVLKTHAANYYATTEWTLASFSFLANGTGVLSFRIVADGLAASTYLLDDVHLGTDPPYHPLPDAEHSHLRGFAFLRTLVDPISGHPRKEDDVAWDEFEERNRGIPDMDQPGTDDLAREWITRHEEELDPL